MATRVVIPEQPRVGTKRKYDQCKYLAISPAVMGLMAKSETQKSRPIRRNFGARLLEKAVERNNSKPITRPIRPIIRNNFGAQLLENAPAAAERNNYKPINRPIIRSFSTQLLENAQVAAEEKNIKLACGVTKKPNVPIVDIDAADRDDELAAVEYIEDMYNYYKLAENDCRHDYMGLHIEIDQTRRAIIVDWLIDIHMRFGLMAESLFLTINILDRYISATKIPSRLLPLVGVSSMLIACKYEEIKAPQVSDLTQLLDDCFITQHVLIMEKDILGKLEWFISVPTPYVFLVRYIKASIPADNEMENMSYFYAELGLVNYRTAINYSPSLLSASAVYAARCTLFRCPFWTETLKHHTGYSEDQLVECATLLVGYHSGIAENKLKVVSEKYSNTERGAVSCYPPASNLISSSV